MQTGNSSPRMKAGEMLLDSLFEMKDLPNQSQCHFSLLENSISKLVEGNFICSRPSGRGQASVWLVFIKVNAVFNGMHGICLTF